MAVLSVSPAVDLTALIASEAVLPGDVLLLQDGVYRQSVLIQKSGVRIVAGGCGVVFDGGGVLSDGFALLSVVGVEISGLHIQNYVADGIHLQESRYNRIADNCMANLPGRGILLLSSSRNALRGNTIDGAFDGILLIDASANNFVLENQAKNCADNGFEAFFSADEGNVFIGNTALGCGEFGFEVLGANCLVYRNCAKGCAHSGFYIAAGPGIVAVENDGWCNVQNGMYLRCGNGFVADNSAWRNESSGIKDDGNWSVLQGNAVSFNRGYGLLLTEQARNNFALRNHLAQNGLENIRDSGTGNALLQNCCVRTLS